MNKNKSVYKTLTEPFIVRWYIGPAFAHGNYDFEHYDIDWYDPKKRKIRQSLWCEGFCGSEVPFNVLEEIEKFDEDKKKYWLSKGVPAEWIKEKEKET